MIGDIFIYVCCMLSGCFFLVMILTIIENKSKKFRNLIRKLTRQVPIKVRKIFVWVCIVLFGYIGFASNFGLTRGGLISGALVGFAVYFKAGVTMGQVPDYGDGSPYVKQKRKKQAEALSQRKNLRKIQENNSKKNSDNKKLK